MVKTYLDLTFAVAPAMLELGEKRLICTLIILLSDLCYAGPEPSSFFQLTSGFCSRIGKTGPGPHVEWRSTVYGCVDEVYSI